MVKNSDHVYSRGWCFTINNYTEDDKEQVVRLSDKAHYIVAGLEVGDSGTPHIQGYVYFKNDCSFQSIKKKLTRAHLEPSRADSDHNEQYCKKDGNVLIEKGVKPSPRQRTDITKVREALEEGADMRDIVQMASSYQSIRVAEVWLKYNEKARDFKPEVRWYHGATGSGKTRQAIEWLGKDYYTPLSFKWWEGYDAHECVLLDDIRGDFCKYNEMLRLLDRFKYRVECKGGSRQLLAKKIAITSPYHPKDIFYTTEDVTQLIRRIDMIVQIGDRVRHIKRADSFDELEQKNI